MKYIAYFGLGLFAIFLSIWCAFFAISFYQVVNTKLEQIVVIVFMSITWLLIMGLVIFGIGYIIVYKEFKK